MTTMLPVAARIGRHGPAAARRAAGRSVALCAPTMLAAIMLVGSLTGPAAARGAPDSFADLAEKVLPAVVNISTTQEIQGRNPDGFNLPEGTPFDEFFKDFFNRDDNGRSVPVTSLGSGFVIDADGIIVTNNHVIADADEITVNFSDNTSLKAEVIGIDKKTDIAVLRVQPEAKLATVTWGDSERLRVGDWVMAVGSPFGLGSTVTAGIVSARARDIDAGPYDDFIQTDASINKGNSGGPLFDMDGKVVGINTAIFSPSGTSIGIGFSISSSLARTVVAQIRAFGRTRRGWLGVKIQQVTEEIADSLGMEEPRGALIASLVPGGPAETSGILTGDVILSFDGKPVPKMRALQRIVADTDVGKAVDVTVWRQEAEARVQVTLGELEVAEEAGMLRRQPQVAARDADADLDTVGMTLAALSPVLRGRYDLDETIRGVVITDVEAGGVAARKELQAGDVIVEVSQEEVRDPVDVGKLIRAAREANKKSVLLLLDRQGELRFVALTVADEP